MNRNISESSLRNLTDSTYTGHTPYSKHIHRTCPLCGADNKNREFIFSEDMWLIKKCAKCSFVYLENPPHYEGFEDEFAWEKISEKNQRPKIKIGVGSGFPAMSIITPRQL